MGLKKKPTKVRLNKRKKTYKDTKKLKKMNQKPTPVSETSTNASGKSSVHCHDKFLSYEEIGAFLLELTTKYPKKIKVLIAGESTGGKPIYLAKISELSSDEPKMATLVEAGSNGTDWMAISSALYLIHALTKNNSYTKIMDYLILPCSNPDAYHYSISENKPSTTNIPMNLSHNFPITLGLNNISLQRTEDVLLGIRKWKDNYRFEAPETLVLIKTITEHLFRIKFFISLQEDGEKIVYPFGFCKENISDQEALKAVAKAGQNAAMRRCFHIGSMINLCGLTLGSVIDFLRMNQHAIKFTYILHLHDKKETADPRDILSCGKEAVSCVKSMAKEVYMHYTGLNATKDCE